MKKFSQLNQNEKYNAIKAGWKAIQKAHGNESKSEFDFLEDDGKVNLFAVRGFKDGQPVKSTNTEFDDTIYVVYQKDGVKYVKGFIASTEYGVVGHTDGGAIITPGQHKYRLAFHKLSLAHKSIKTGGRPRKGNKYQYRAFKPDPHVEIFRDKDKDLVADSSKTYLNNSINIHFANTIRGSAGCQILSGWDNYKDFIELVESDHSIKGTKRNELAPKPEKDGTRSVIYTLVTGDEFVKIYEKQFYFPLDLGKGLEVTTDSVEDYYDKTEKEIPGGYFPVGSNTYWHGGLHLHGSKGESIYSTFNGEIVAARLHSNEADAVKSYGSRNFICVRHEVDGKKLYSLYMHLNNIPLTEESFKNEGIGWVFSNTTEYLVCNAGKEVPYRSAPGIKSNPKSKKLGNITDGQRVELVGCEEDPDGDNWYKIKLENGTTGYIFYKNDTNGNMKRDVEKTLDQAVIDTLGGSGVAKLNIPVLAGEKLWSMGEYGEEDNRKAMIHWEMFSETNFFAGYEGFQEVTDPDNDYNLESSQIVDMFEPFQKTNWFDSGEIDSDELNKFYRESENRKELRKYACNFISEWGIPDLDHAISNMGKWFTFGLKEKIEPYVWWQDALDAGCNIPPSAHVWHFNPITVMKQIADVSAIPPLPDRNPPDDDRVIDEDMDVETMQGYLRELGFLLVGTPDGDYGRMTTLAVREFQIYAKMNNVAKVKDNVSDELKTGAHEVAELGKEGNLSKYVDSLEQVANDNKYEGPVCGIATDQTKEKIKHWVENYWRCPVIVEAWTMSSGSRSNLQDGGVNIWYHDDVKSTSPRMYVRDFTGYYDFPAGHDENDMIVIGDWVSYLSWNGPRSVPPRHTWSQGELLPVRMLGTTTLNASQTSTFKVVRAVSEVECLGFSDSINCYDNAFVSVGPCHWTLGIISSGSSSNVSEGEMCGFLAYFRHAYCAAFEKAIQFFGASVDEDWNGGAGNGAPLFKSGSRKYAGWMALQKEDSSFGRIPLTEKDGDYFKTWHWFYRFAMAGRTIDDYVKAMWDMARIRLRDIRNTPWGTGPWGSSVSDVTLGDVFTSEKAMGMILRWHIRFPGDVISGGNTGSRMKNALQYAQTNASSLNWTSNPTVWTDAHETTLISGLDNQVAARGNSGLNDSISYVKNWPSWVTGSNSRHYTLSSPVTALSTSRNSFDFNSDGL